MVVLMPAGAPEAHIYVIGAPLHLESAGVGARTWWCVERTAAVGEIGALYIKGGHGFRFLFRLLAFSGRAEFHCREHGLATGEVEILAALKTPISSQDLRQHPTLRRLPAIRRSFQRRSFRLEQPFLGALTEMFAARMESERSVKPIGDGKASPTS